eukprot:499767-Rhodomonas_salina.1
MQLGDTCGRMFLASGCGEQAGLDPVKRQAGSDMVEVEERRSLEGKIVIVKTHARGPLLARERWGKHLFAAPNGKGRSCDDCEVALGLVKLDVEHRLINKPKRKRLHTIQSREPAQHGRVPEQHASAEYLSKTAQVTLDGPMKNDISNEKSSQQAMPREPNP